MHPVWVSGGRVCAHVCAVASAIVLTGCANLGAYPTAERPAAPDASTVIDAAADGESAAAAPEPAGRTTAPADAAADPRAETPPAVRRDAARRLAQRPQPGADEETELEQYDPWERFNEKMFDFNLKVDRYVLKPVARVYRRVVPDQVQIMISNGFDNIRVVPRVVNNLLQGKIVGAVSEATRFALNSTLGFGGLFDVGKHAGIERRGEDFGQTLGVWGAGPGPYLVLPFLEPMTVRDGIGRGVDLFIDPFGYFVPFVPERLLMRIEDTINERALNYDLFQGVEETTLDLYSSVRHFYLNRRERQIRE